jgi:hypothetical protein
MAVQIISISEPVGFGTSSLAKHRPVRNLPDDVSIVQDALNQIDPGKGGAFPRLTVNGKITGSEDPTVKAIRNFQRHQLGFEDGVVDPGNKTENKLHEVLRALGGGATTTPGPTPPGAPSTGRVVIVNQPAGEIFPLTILPDEDGQGGRPLKPDLNSVNRQLSSSSKLAKMRVWAAKLGLGAAVLDELEKAAQAPVAFDIKTLLVKLVASGSLERALFDEITFNDLRGFPDVDLGHRMSTRAVGVNEALLRNEMSVGGSTALGMFTFWTSHSAVPPPLQPFPALDADTAKTANFITAAEAFEKRVKENLRKQFSLGRVDYHDLVTGPGPERDPKAAVPAEEPGKATGRPLPAIEPILPDLSITRDTVVKICIGSFQGIRVSLSGFQGTASGVPGFPGTFSGTLHYELRDHFGVDDEDCEVRTAGIHGTPGQVAMWVLQHYAPTGHKPFIDQVRVQRKFTGSF